MRFYMKGVSRKYQLLLAIVPLLTIDDDENVRRAY